ncbi:MAG TPA: C25 family cysteine peptidase [Bacteroidales bacterium]|nr:C25 family cysteine peptidase [Bacteroidales bacterium]
MGSGKDKQAGLLIFLLGLSLYVNCQPAANHRFHFEGNQAVNQIRPSINSIKVNYSISDLDMEVLSNERGKYFRISIPGHVPTTAIGKPELPVFSRLITIPDNFSFKINITEIRSKTIVPRKSNIEGILYPAQEGDTKTLRDKKPFIIDETTYTTPGLLNQDTVRIEPAGRVRGKNLANLMVFPIRYDPRKNLLEVITSMEIEIIFTGPEQYLPETIAFSGILSKGLSNYYQSDFITGYSDQPVRMIILTDTSFSQSLDPLIRWKRQKGFDLEIIYRGSEYAGVSFSEIKTTISDIYNSSGENPPPDYLLIIGDVSVIPLSEGTTNITDLYYAEFDGNGDYIPEMFVGRLPVKDTSELRSVVKKIIQYEKFEFADTNNFYSNSLATTGYDASYATFMNGQVRYAVTNYLTPENNINEYHFYYPQNEQEHKDSVIKIINKGISFMNYSGHGSPTGWLHIGIDTSDVSKLTNNNMYPFVVSNSCFTSRYNMASLGNRMVISNDKGAIGFIGCSSDSYWFEDFYWSVGVGTPSENPTYETTGPGFYDRMFHTNGEKASDWYFTMGQVNYAGNLAVTSSTSSRKKYYWETYNLVGDPSLIPFIGTPGQFSITLPDRLPEDITSWSFIAEPFSYIAVSCFDTLWDASHASPSGSVTLDLPADKGDSCMIVITGQNKKPFTKTIYFSEINEEFISLTNTEINDVKGNNDGNADYGESVYLNLTIKNFGATDATNLTARITSASEWANIINGTAVIGTLGAGNEISVSDILEFQVTEEIPDNGLITFDLILEDNYTEKTYKIDIETHAPVLDILSCIINDTETGNGDFIADAGETFKLVFRVRNNGSSHISGDLVISSSDAGFTILEPTKNSGDLLPGEISDVAILVRLSSFINYGTTISVDASLDCDPYFSDKRFSFRTGRLRESFELESFTLFPWINISSVPWIITESGTVDGIIAARSGMISHNNSSSLIMKTWYQMDDSLSFYYKVSSEKNCDHLIFKLNDEEVFRKSGETGWEKKTIGIPSGFNKLEWVYNKDISISEGNDNAMIDMIDFAKTSTVQYIEKDLITGKIVSPARKDNLGRENVTVKVLNIGPDTINGFNLAYRLNDGPAVEQHFNEILYPSFDSISVTFNTMVNMSRYGKYNIVVYSYNNNDQNFLNDTLSVVIENNVADEALIAYPNPFRDELNLVINSEIDDIVRISLFNSMGKTIHEMELPVTSGMNETIIRNRRLVPGIYYLRLTIQGKSITIPVINMRK